ncbi:MAG TPA: hypothetical protein VM098_03250 [Phycisphaerae bacterium]|nr:hypothetical protein [Phycisphaerae bacterium]
MKAAYSVVLLVLVAAMFCGCATYNKMSNPVASIAKTGLINDPKLASELEKAMTDQGVAKLFELDVPAKLPTKLAVAKLTSSYGGAAHIEPIGARELKQWEDITPDPKLVTGVQYVSGLMLQKDSDRGITLRALRVAAAQMHCELLLAYIEDSASVNNYNDFAALYWTFVGLWVVPGNVLEQRTVMQAVILDCRTGAILGTAVGDAHLKEAAPLALMQIAEDRMRTDAPKKALAELQAACKGVLAEIVKQSLEAHKKAGK